MDEDVLIPIVPEAEGLAFLQPTVNDEAADENGREQRSKDTDGQGGGETLHRTSSEEVKDDSHGECGDIGVQDRG